MQFWKQFRDKLVGLITSRMFLLGTVIIILMCLLIHRLFVLQIVNGQTYQDNFTLKIERERTIKATRGSIYDRNGKVLAQDKLAYSVTMEDNYDSTPTKDMEINDTILRLIDIIERNGDKLDNDFNIVLDENGNYQFTVTGSGLLRFLADCYGKSSVDKLLIREKNSSAEDVIAFLCSSKMFGVGRYIQNDRGGYDLIPMEGYSREQILKILRIRFAMFSNNYQKYIASNVATDVNEKTVAEIMENLDTLRGVNIAEDTIRVYIDDPSMSHILGYTGKISNEELVELNEAEAVNTWHHEYELNDMVGKAGIEQVMERALQGTKGRQTIFVDNLGRVTEAAEQTNPVAGNDLYLTIDSDLQSAIYKILEQKIAGIVISKIRNVREFNPEEVSSAADIIIPIDNVYAALFENNVISLTHLSAAEKGTNEAEIYNAYLSKLDSTLAVLSEEMNRGAVPVGELDAELKGYETYTVDMLKNLQAIRTDQIEEGDETEKQWTEGTIPLSRYLRDAITKGWVDIGRIGVSGGYSDSDEIFQSFSDYTLEKLRSDMEFSKKLYRYMIRDEMIHPIQICQCLYEQDIIQEDGDTRNDLTNGMIDPYDFMLARIRKLEITPAQLALDPCSGSCVVTDPNSGEVLALVSYPSYDDNMMANSVDADYFNKIAHDKSLPLYNYATQEKTAPGSTFKPVSTTAGLEEGVINLGERIECVGVFEKIDSETRAPRCWIYPGRHGELDVVGGIKNSCNYFFYEVGYRLSSGLTGLYDNQTGLTRIRKYCDLYGLTDKSGIELTESEPKVSDIDAVRSAIGQGSHSYTTVQIARYVNTVANKGVCYNLSVLDRIMDANGKLIIDYTPEIRNNINISSSTWGAIHQGMRAAVTTYHAFDDFPVLVAGKTGTAQQVTTRPNHALFIGFAPYQNPRISVATRIAYGYTSSNAAEVTRDVLKYYFKLQDVGDIITGEAAIPDSAAIGD